MIFLIYKFMVNINEIVNILIDIRLHKIKRDLELIFNNKILISKYMNYYDIKISIIDENFIFKKFNIDGLDIKINKLVCSLKKKFHSMKEKIFNNRLIFKNFNIEDYMLEDSKKDLENYLRSVKNRKEDSRTFVCLYTLNLKYDYKKYYDDIKNYCDHIMISIKSDMINNFYLNEYIFDLNFNIYNKIGEYLKFKEDYDKGIYSIYQ